MKTLTGHDVIEEIRAARRQMSEECHHDPKELVGMLRRYEVKYSRQIRRYSGAGQRGRVLSRTA